MYTGDGQVGDQLEREGNLALIRAKSQGKVLRLFVADGFVDDSKTIRQLYLGAFELDEALPYTRAEAPGRNGQLRSVFVFRLRATGPALRREKDGTDVAPATTSLEIDAVPVAAGVDVLSADVEAHNSATFTSGGSQPGQRSRVESDLVKRYETYLSALGHSVARRRIRPPGEIRYLLTDTFDETANELYEAKGTATRDSVRLAPGQLIDYGRWTPTAARTVLLPSRPSNDLLALLEGSGVGCVWQATGGTFERHGPA